MRTNGLATASLVCGIAAMLTLCVIAPLLVLAPLAMMFGLIALASPTAKSPLMPSAKRAAVAGIILGTSAPLIALLLITIIFVRNGVFRPMTQIIFKGMTLAAQSEKVTGAMNAVAIVNACRMYCAAHDGYYPPSLAILLSAHQLVPEQLQCASAPSSDADSKGGQNGQVVKPAATQPNSNRNDFIYIGADLADHGAPISKEDRVIVVYSKDCFDGTGRAIGFSDGNSEFVETQNLAEVIAASNKNRAKNGLTPLTLDNP